MDFFFILTQYIVVRPPHYKDHFSSAQVVVLIVEFYCRVNFFIDVPLEIIEISESNTFDLPETIMPAGVLLSQ